MQTNYTMKTTNEVLKEIKIPENLRHLIPSFIERRTLETQRLKKLLDDNCFEEIREIGHKIKGHGLGYGFQQISKAGHLIEKNAMDSDKEALGVLIAEYRDYIRVVSQHLDKI